MLVSLSIQHCRIPQRMLLSIKLETFWFHELRSSFHDTVISLCSSQESARTGISDSRMLQLSVHETDSPLLQMCISLEDLFKRND